MSFPEPFYRWRPHPWHGLEVGPKPPQIVNAFIEITPFDLMKYEVDKTTGYLRVDRPQRSSSQHPSLYGFIPRTLCGPRVGAISKLTAKGDGDPLDICVLSERPINRGEVILHARVIGGILILEARDLNHAVEGVPVLDNDRFWAKAQDISDIPDIMIERLRHYFATYKLIPGEPVQVSIEQTYGRERAEVLVQAAMGDYKDIYGG